MTGIYYTDMADVLAAAGCTVAENDTTAGWQHRARSSGGFPAPPLAVFWHHTASRTTPANDLAYMVDGSPDAPVGNLLIDRDGICWPIAAGASNCAGKGGPASFTRGTIPADCGNTRGWQLEVANDGLGEPWPSAQMDSYFRASNALNAHAGNRPDDIIGHAHYAPERKIDPATAAAVQGPWRPHPINGAGTWSLEDMRAEALRRAGTPTPTPEDDMPAPILLAASDGPDTATVFWWDGMVIGPIGAPDALDLGPAAGLYRPGPDGAPYRLARSQIDVLIRDSWNGAPRPGGW